jgi:hypothetical protein
MVVGQVVAIYRPGTKIESQSCGYVTRFLRVNGIYAGSKSSCFDPLRYLFSWFRGVAEEMNSQKREAFSFGL